MAGGRLPTRGGGKRGRMSGLENCPTCGNKTSIRASQCPSCGEPLAEGWADRIRQERAEAEESARRSAAEAEEATKRATLKEQQAKRRSARRQWAAIAVLAFLLAGWFLGPKAVDALSMEFARMFDPTRYERVVAERQAAAEQERLLKVQALEVEVAKVPVANTAENIRLYRDLQKLDPQNLRYSDKIAFYEARQREEAAAATAAAAALVARAREAAAAAAAADTKRKADAQTAEAAKKAEERRAGFHCLSAWDGSHRAVVAYVKERLREPSSFEHISTRITPVNDKGEHTLVMEYRARNGFGGMNVGSILATIRNSDCSATVVSK